MNPAQLPRCKTTSPCASISARALLKTNYVPFSLTPVSLIRLPVFCGQLWLLGGLMFSGIQMMAVPTDANLANHALSEESTYRFHAFSADDAVTLGLSIRKRFRASSRHGKGKGLVISIQTITGHTLFSCTVGDLGHPSGIADVSLDSWACLEGMVDVVKRTSHSSYFVEKGMSAMGKTAKQIGLDENMRVSGGAFPIWLENAPCCPIAIVAAYSGSSQDDHNLVVNTVRDYIKKLRRNSEAPGIPEPGPGLPHPSISEWVSESGYGNGDLLLRRPEGSLCDHGNHEQHHEQYEDEHKE